MSLRRVKSTFHKAKSLTISIPKSYSNADLKDFVALPEDSHVVSENVTTKSGSTYILRTNKYDDLEECESSSAESIHSTSDTSIELTSAASNSTIVTTPNTSPLFSGKIRNTLLRSASRSRSLSRRSSSSNNIARFNTNSKRGSISCASTVSVDSTQTTNQSIDEAPTFRSCLTQIVEPPTSSNSIEPSYGSPLSPKYSFSSQSDVDSKYVQTSNSMTNPGEYCHRHESSISSSYYGSIKSPTPEDNWFNDVRHDDSYMNPIHELMADEMAMKILEKVGVEQYIEEIRTTSGWYL